MSTVAPVRETIASRLRGVFAARGVTLSWVSKELEERGTPVSISTLSYWCSGLRKPETKRSIDALTHLEEMFGLDVGELVGLVGHHRSRPQDAYPPIAGSRALQDAVDELGRELGVAPPGTTRVLSAFVTVDVGPTALPERVHARYLVEGLTGVNSRLALPLVGSGGQPVRVPTRVTASLGATVAGTRVHHSDRALVVAVDLERPLLPGRTVIVDVAREYSILDEADDFLISEYFPLGAREVVIVVEFDTTAIPEWLEESDILESGRKMTYRNLDTDRSIHVTRHRLSPGTLELRWGLDDDGESDAF